MRVLLATLVIAAVGVGCTPTIPVKDDFGTSALTPGKPGIAEVPPEYVEFNNFDPAVNNLLADQMCATPYQPLEARTLDAATGKIVQARGRCKAHVPIFGE